MLQLFREYPVEFYQRIGPEKFELARSTISVVAEGPMVEVLGHLQAIDFLSGKIVPYLKKNWHRRWLVSTAEEVAYARQHNAPIAECATGTNPHTLAEYLLLAVFEPMFRDDGLLVKRVHFFLSPGQEGDACIDEVTARAYKAEAAKRDDVLLKAEIENERCGKAGGIGPRITACPTTSPQHFSTA